jgi:hypothetical protein
MGFKVFGVSRQEVASIAEECKLIEIFNMYEFRNAADRALRGVAKRLVCLVCPPFLLLHLSSRPNRAVLCGPWSRLFQLIGQGVE